MVNHGSCRRICFYLNKTSDILFVTEPCFHLNADWLTSQRKHIPCSRTTLDIPVGFFTRFLFLSVQGFYTAGLSSKLSPPKQISGIQIGGHGWGLHHFPSKQNTEKHVITYLGFYQKLQFFFPSHSQKQGDLRCLLVVKSGHETASKCLWEIHSEVYVVPN